MRQRHPGFRKLIGSGLLAVSTLGAALAAPAPDASLPGRDEIPDDAVAVQLLEGFEDGGSWESTTDLVVTDTYLEPAFASIGVPRRYGEGGQIVDRAQTFVLRATGKVVLVRGRYRLLLRSFNAARLFLNDEVIASTRFLQRNTAGHEPVPDTVATLHTQLRPLQAGHTETVVDIAVSDGEHVFRLEATVGGKNLRPEIGELQVGIAPLTHDASAEDPPSGPFRLLSPGRWITLSTPGWLEYAGDATRRLVERNRLRRREARAVEDDYWARRHELAREYVASLPPVALPGVSSSTPTRNPIDLFIGQRLEQGGVSPTPLTDDWQFLRRVSLDVRGVPPRPTEIRDFHDDPSPHRRARFIDRMLESHTDDSSGGPSGSSGWADHWVSYWQDVLAENPGLVKPKLNNTGPFRWWLHEALSDNLPADRFVTELVLMRGSRYGGGAAGFSLATANDVPMAAKAHILGTAFLGVEMRCARCHDAPNHSYKQKDLFSMAALLERGPQEVPETSSVPGDADELRHLLVEVTLEPGTKVEPAWPFEELVRADGLDDVLRDPDDSRERLAAIITSPRNERFARVLANRLWKRYLGHGLVEPVDDWEFAEPSHPRLLELLGRELMTHGYDLKHLARLILNSDVYQRRPVGFERKVPAPTDRLFAGPARRKMRAEQIVDSLFRLAEVDFRCEALNMDVDGRRPVRNFINFGTPRRAWEFVSLSNERDRPALSMPVAQSFVDVLKAFGWRETRQDPLTVREDVTTVLQPLTLSSGVVARRVTTLSDSSAFTKLSLDAQSPGEVIEETFLRVLSRTPSQGERELFATLLEEGFEDRIAKDAGDRGSAGDGAPSWRKRHSVSWSNHLHADATRIKLEIERAVQEGDPPTSRLRAPWRERVEDMLWVLVNSPDFVFVP